MDRDGTKDGYDLELTRMIADAVDIPVIASGGMGSPSDLVDAVNIGTADAIAMAHVLHYDVCSLSELRTTCRSQNIPTRVRQ